MPQGRSALLSPECRERAWAARPTKPAKARENPSTRRKSRAWMRTMPCSLPLPRNNPMRVIAEPTDASAMATRCAVSFLSAPFATTASFAPRGATAPFISPFPVAFIAPRDAAKRGLFFLLMSSPSALALGVPRRRESRLSNRGVALSTWISPAFTADGLMSEAEDRRWTR